MLIPGLIYIKYRLRKGYDSKFMTDRPRSYLGSYTLDLNTDYNNVMAITL